MVGGGGAAHCRTCIQHTFRWVADRQVGAQHHCCITKPAHGATPPLTHCLCDGFVDGRLNVQHNKHSKYDKYDKKDDKSGKVCVVGKSLGCACDGWVGLGGLFVCM